MTNRIIMIGVFLAICCQSGFGNTVNDPVDLLDEQWENVERFLTPDGRFDLDAARRSGYEGALDFSGFAIHFDSKTGEPLFSKVAQEHVSTDHNQYGLGGSFPCPQGREMDNPVRALTVYTNLIAGGTFTEAGCHRVSCLAGWNGTSWDSVGCGLQSGALMEVRALTVYAGNLIVGGNFTGVGCWPGIPANCIARWNGTNWSALGSGMSGGLPMTIVYALTVCGGKLIAGGNFTLAGGVTSNCIAQWNGSTWSSLAQRYECFLLYTVSLCPDGLWRRSDRRRAV